MYILCLIPIVLMLTIAGYAIKTVLSPYMQELSKDEAKFMAAEMEILASTSACRDRLFRSFD